MRKSVSFFVLPLAAALLAMPAFAADTPAQAGMELLKQFNLISLGDTTVTGSDHVEGKVFIGGDLNGELTATLSSTGSTTTSDYAELTVGGNVNGKWHVEHSQSPTGTALVQIGGNSGQATMNVNGHVDIGGTFDTQEFNPSATKSVTTNEAGLASAILTQKQTFSIDLHALSDTLAALSSTPIADMSQSLSFAGDYAVFSMTAAQFSTGNYDFKTLFSQVSSSQTVIINVLGASAVEQSSQNFNVPSGADPANILWNFNQATAVSVSNWQGSILAPDATVTQTAGNITGSIAAKIFNQGGEVHLGTFNGTSRYLVTTDTPPVGSVPEPASWMTMLTGFGLVGSLIRRNRRRERLAAA